MNKVFLNGLAAAVLLGISLSVSAAEPRSCDDKQVYLAVMESARHDLPSPYSDMDVKGSDGVTTLKKGQCKMALLLNDGSGGELKKVDVLYKTTVPLSQIHVTPASSTKTTQSASKNCKAVQFKKGELAAVVEGTTTENKTDCYTVKTGANQTMTAELIGNSDDIKNTAITIPGIGDVRDTFQFKTEKKTYEIHVSQIKGVAEKKPYGLNITVY